LSSSTLAPLVAQIGTNATNNGNPISSRNVFRANAAQIQAATKNPLLAATVNITPLSTEVALAIENQGLSFNQATANLAQRIGVSTASNVLLPPNQVTNSADQAAILKESVIAQGRLTLAAKFVDRGDTVGELRGNFDCPAVANFDSANADVCSGTDQSTVAIPAAQQWAFNLEGMPQYDYVFVIVEENESQNAVYGKSTLPYINSFLNSGNLYYNYFSTGDPSEPNYLALGAADDFGQTGTMYRDVMTDTDRDHLVGNIVGHAGDHVTEPVQLRVVAYWSSVDPELGARVAAGLGRDTSTPAYAEAAKLVEARANRA